MSVVRKILRTKIQVSKKLNKIDCFNQIVLFVARKNWLSLKIKNSIKQYSTILIIFEIIKRFTKHRERIQKFREIGHLKHLYRNELDKASFVHDAVYSNSKDLAKSIISDKVLKETDYEITRNPKHDGYQIALASMVYNFLTKNRIKSKCTWGANWRST